jgi:uncharacterized protein (DUF1697 family)
MNTHIALFRGINVMGRNTLPMKELAAILEGLGAGRVRTQSVCIPHRFPLKSEMEVNP